MLRRAAYVPGLADTGASFTATVEAMAEAVEQWADRKWGTEFVLLEGARLVVERQRAYGGRAARGDASDLIDVAVVVGAVMGRLGIPTRIAHSQEWKGTIKKPRTRAEYVRDGYVVEARARRDLSAEELARVELTKSWDNNLDVWDAVGMGLWATAMTDK